jgi:hypothetical protein
MSSRSIEPLGSNHPAQTIARTARVRGIGAIKAALQKAAIHRDRRDRRRTPYFPVIRSSIRTTITTAGSPLNGDHGDFAAESAEITGISLFTAVMTGLVPAIHVFDLSGSPDRARLRLARPGVLLK